MKVVNTTLTYRPNIDVEFYDVDAEDSLIESLKEDMIINGKIISITKTQSEDQLTLTVIKIFASIDDYIYLFKTQIDGEEIGYTQKHIEYIANNGITETRILTFQE